MKKETKYRLIRTACEFLVITTLATGISHISTNIKYPKEQILYTQEDQIHNLTFNKELTSILEQKQITFSNPELEYIIKKQIGGPITKETLQSLKSLEILNTLSNNDFSDLKYSNCSSML